MAFLSTILLLPLLISTVQTSSSAANLTAYEVLEQYDFPIGLLPNGVTSYELDSSTGKFSATINETCTFTIDSYELKYKSKITGVIATDKLSSLSGVQVKILFVWLSIVEVSRDDDELAFSVGVASANFGVDNFVESPTCGCGFDCGSVKLRKIRGDRSVFSS
ncbi:hypothetical protein M5689_004334 [Euphorbia peplus]|nr:hypothetical protein M5689_004334 [Euphorbia peplus]